MIGLYLYGGLAVLAIAAFFYIKAIGRRDAELDALRNKVKANEDVKKIRDRVANMPINHKRSWVRKHLRR